ncbi:MAG TPA: hypothetical protein VFM35_10745, partial [Candidatus Binatia bacterium]|nr:hypothetical protein [Candidatus Binatia bacterium]
MECWSTEVLEFKPNAPLLHLSSSQVMTIFRRSQSEFIDAIEVRGNAAFRSDTQEALALLRSSSLFSGLRKYLPMIQQGKRSGMRAWAKKPTFVVGKPTWQHSALWYAGAIAHDAYHAKLYQEAKQKSGREPEADYWTGEEAEKKCLDFQRRILMELKADEKTIAYIKECEKNPT